MMNKKMWRIVAGVFALAMMALWAAPARAQEGPKEKPPMYSYVGNWNIPRAQWAEMDKTTAAEEAVLAKALADGTIVGFGDDLTLVHQPDGSTHDQWWSAMSMAAVVNVLGQFYKNGSAVSPALASATKHWDNIFVSRFYNWRPGTYKGAYTRVASYKLKADASEGAIGTLSKNLFVPLLEKLLADGTILEYEIDTEAIHSESVQSFWIVYIAPNADGLDKYNAALSDAQKMNPLGGPAFVSMVDFSGHRDSLDWSNLTYK
ncbi:MAG: hypothetical protein PHX83_03805 [Acidobacteriia bacterium]|nr:hypothetical protein [Terriglobia bacterium]